MTRREEIEEIVKWLAKRGKFNISEEEWREMNGNNGK